MRILHAVIGVFVIVPVVFGDVLKPPRVVAKNVHKSHITHHSLNTEGEDRLQKAETGYYPTEDSCAKALNVSKVRIPSATDSNTPAAHLSMPLALQTSQAHKSLQDDPINQRLCKHEVWQPFKAFTLISDGHNKAEGHIARAVLLHAGGTDVSDQGLHPAP